MAKSRPAVGTTVITDATSRAPFHFTITEAIESAVRRGSTTMIIELCRLLNRTCIPREHLLPIAARLRTYSYDGQNGHHALVEATKRLEAEYERLIR